MMVYATISEKDGYLLRVAIDTNAIDGWLETVKITDEGEYVDDRNYDWIKNHFGEDDVREAERFKSDMLSDMRPPAMMDEI